MGSRHSATLLYYLLPRSAIRSSAGYTIDTHESRFRKRQVDGRFHRALHLGAQRRNDLVVSDGVAC